VNDRNTNDHEELISNADQFFKRTRTGAAFILGYVPPQYHDNPSGAYIDYYVKHPATGVLKRIRVKWNRVRDPIQRKLYAHKYMIAITHKLQEGWTPWDALGNDHYSTIEEVLDRWDNVKAKSLRHSAAYSYMSLSAILREWLRDQGLLKSSVLGFNRAVVAGFLSYVLEKRRVTNRTYNNYLVFVSMIGKWMVENNILQTSPVQHFKKKKEERKSRTYLSDSERRQMMDWIQKNEPNFLFPCLFIFGTLIRPGELRRLRLHHLDLERQVVMLPAEETKTGIERTPAIPDWMAAMLRTFDMRSLPSKSYLVSNNFLPGEQQLSRNALNRVWVRMRNDLDWDTQRQLYSLRDTGIIQLLRDGVDLLHVMQQAGHTEVATTNQYLKHAFPKGPAEVRSMATPITAATALVKK
jgi:integrase